MGTVNIQTPSPETVTLPRSLNLSERPITSKQDSVLERVICSSSSWKGLKIFMVLFYGY